MTITLSAFQQQRRDTAANWTSQNPTLKAGEIGFETDTKYIKIGDGSTAWTSLAYIHGSKISAYPLATADLADGAVTSAKLENNITIAGNLTVNGTTTTIDTTTLVVEDKNIEIGKVSTPTDTTADGGGITLKGASDKTINWVQSTGCWTFNQPTNFNNHVLIDSSGKVGINISNPSDYNSSGNELVLGKTGNNSGMTIVSGTANSGTIFFADGTGANAAIRGAIKYEHNNNALAFNTDTTERMRIDSSGNVGIGTTSASALLEVNSPTAGNEVQRIEGNYSGSGSVVLSNWRRAGGAVAANFQYHDSSPIRMSLGTSTSHNFALKTGNTDRLTIDSSGTVGINNDIVFGNQAATGTGGTGRLVATGGEVYIQGGLAKTSGSSAPILFTAYGGVNERMRIDSSGRLLVGTNTNDNNAPFTVCRTGSGGSTPAVGSGTIATFRATGGLSHEAYISILGGSSGRSQINLGDRDDEDTAYIQANHADNSLRFGVNGSSERMRIDSSGNVGIAASGQQGAYTDYGKAVVFGTSSETTLGLVIRTGTSGTSSIAFADNSGSGGGAQDGLIEYSQANRALAFHTAATERLRINSSGKVLIGNPAGFVASGVLNIQTDSNKTISFNADQGELGDVASIMARNDASAALVPFGIRAEDIRLATQNSERLRIDSSGNVFIGGTTAASADIALNANGSITANGQISSKKLAVVNDDGTNNTWFYAPRNLNSTEYAFAAKNQDGTSTLGNAGVWMMGVTKSGVLNMGDLDAGGVVRIALDGTSGNATFAGSVTAQSYVTSSDQRFKENITDANPQLADVTALGNSLRNWDWSADAPVADKETRFLGLVAQEAEAICPGIVKTIARTKQGAELTPEVVVPAVYETRTVPAVLDEEGEVVEAETTEQVLVTKEQVTPATYEELDNSYKGISHDALIMKLLGAVAELSAEVEALKAG